jgi:hypothetical protein
MVEGTDGTAKAQIGDNLAYGENIEGKQTDYLQVNIIHSYFYLI